MQALQWLNIKNNLCPSNNDKPYVLRVAELIYNKVVNIKKENSQMTNIQAFEVFMTGKKQEDYDLISSGEFHNQWFLELKENDFIDKLTKKKINEETIKLLELQKDSMVKFLMKIPKLYYTEKSFSFRNISKSFRSSMESL